MAQTVKPGQPSPPGRRRRLGTGCVLVALVLLVGGLFVLRLVVQAASSKALAQQLAPAERWDVDLGVASVPLWLLGLPADARVHGVAVRPPGGPRLSDVRIQLQGIRYDVFHARLRAARRIAVELLLDEQGLLDSLRQAPVFKNAAELKVTISAGQLGIDGQIDAGGLGLRQMAGLGALRITAAATPEVAPPSSVALRFTSAAVHLPEGLSSLLNGGRPIELGPRELAALAEALPGYDLAQLVKGIRLEACVADEAGLHLKGTVDPTQWTF